MLIQRRGLLKEAEIKPIYLIWIIPAKECRPRFNRNLVPLPIYNFQPLVIMQILVNDQPVDFEGLTLWDLLHNNNLVERQGLAVAVNESVVSKSQWALHKLSEQDSILIINPVQGG